MNRRSWVLLVLLFQTLNRKKKEKRKRKKEKNQFYISNTFAILKFGEDHLNEYEQVFQTFYAFVLSGKYPCKWRVLLSSLFVYHAIFRLGFLRSWSGFVGIQSVLTFSLFCFWYGYCRCIPHRRALGGLEKKRRVCLLHLLHCRYLTHTHTHTHTHTRTRTHTHTHIHRVYSKTLMTKHIWSVENNSLIHHQHGQIMKQQWKMHAPLHQKQTTTWKRLVGATERNWKLG